MTDEPLEEYEIRARLFEAFATQIRLNKDYKFGGAFLLIAPGATEPASSLMLNQDQPGIFWAAVKTLADIAIQETDKQNRGFGR